jgi:hypothetical protein
MRWTPNISFSFSMHRFLLVSVEFFSLVENLNKIEEKEDDDDDDPFVFVSD